MNMNPLSIVNGVLDKLIPDAAERQKLKNEARRLEQNGEFHEMDLAMQAIVMEAKSNDPWTSRARPSFLYVMYLMILSSIVAGIVSVWHPAEVTAAINGMEQWLAGIPEEMWWLFGAGYLGYVKKRSDDKKVIAGQNPAKLLGLL